MSPTPDPPYFDHAVAEWFVRPEYRDLILADTTPARLLDTMSAWAPPAVAKWIDHDAGAPSR